MEDLNIMLVQVSLLIANSSKGHLINTELNRLRTLLNHCGHLMIGDEEQTTRAGGFDFRSETFERIESASNIEEILSATHNVQLSSDAKIPIQRGMTDFGGLLKQTDKVKESVRYIEFTLKAITTVISTDTISEKMKVKAKGFKMAAMAINHRLRICRLMIILNLMNQELLYGYLESLDKAESQTMMHLLQQLVVDSSIIDRFTFSTFEQVAYGIDTFHTIQKIKRLLREPLTLMSKHICNHSYFGQLLDSFFQQHTSIDFNLLMNAIQIHYDLSQKTVQTLASFLSLTFSLNNENPFIDVQELIQLTDFISIPNMLLFLESGQRNLHKTEDLLLKNLAAPSIQHFSLVKSFSKVHIDFNEHTPSRLISLCMIQFNALRLHNNGTYELTFENTVDEKFLDEFILQSDEYPASHKSTFFRQNRQESIDETGLWTDKKFKQSIFTEFSDHMQVRRKDLEVVCKALQRYQTYNKLRMLELIELETREKERQASLTLNIDNLTTYKPVIHPHMIRFNEEMLKEVGIEQKLALDYQKRSSTLLSNIIKKLEESNLQHEKLAVLRKLQKQKEKKQLLSERIEQENTTTSPAIQAQHSRRETKAIIIGGTQQFGPSETQKMQTMPTLGDNKRNSLGMIQEDTMNKDQLEKANTHPATQVMNRPPTLMMRTPNSQLNQTMNFTPETVNQETIIQLNAECSTQASFLTHLQKNKSRLLLQSEKLESLLLRADEHFAKERVRLIKSLRKHEDQIVEREKSIRDMMAEIADFEMRRNIVSDELEENTLRTIEVINISDIKIERDNLERDIIELERKQGELDRIESDLMKEKEKIDEKRRRRRLGLENKTQLNVAGGNTMHSVK